MLTFRIHLRILKKTMCKKCHSRATPIYGKGYGLSQLKYKNPN